MLGFHVSQHNPSRLELALADFARVSILVVRLLMRCTRRRCLVGFGTHAALEWLVVAVRTHVNAQIVFVGKALAAKCANHLCDAVHLIQMSLQ